ncbi:exonuclease SbcCD subunit D [Virgibacillus kekensis]|uniref:Exonuclease SbcCD subunit D n=1 Tax=Virgibacillus kekensis TaxID=202261 RepID=A0ABV9DJY7_9BACI
MAEQISFIHVADLHLDSPFKGLADLPEDIFRQVTESTFSALDQLVSKAIEKQVDFILIVGDLFDNERQSLKAQVRLRRAFEKLQEYGINVYLSYGNHDFIKGNIHAVTYPDNVFIFPDESVTHFIYEKNENTKAAIYGFSYENRSVTAVKAQEYIRADGEIPYHIASLHGSLHSNTDHDVYAPFHLSDLIGNNFDYWALGHIHQRQILHHNPPVVYPGNTQGRNRKETGEKGCYHVILSNDEPQLEFMPLHAMKFNEVTIDVSACSEVHQLESAINRAINQKENTEPELIQLSLSSENNNLPQWDAAQLVEEIIELVNETNVFRPDWKFIFRFSVERRFAGMEDELRHGEHFVGELIRHADEVSIQPYLKELQHHKQARKYLGTITAEQEENIREKAKQLLINELLKNGGE